MGGLGMGELIVILVIVLLVFGANRLPQIGEGVGKAIRNLKRGLNTDEEIEVTPKDKQVASRTAPAAKDEVSDAEVVERR
ncbi:MAG: twin-arginine translocase TatA/TatE family subunit [Sandaracinus sp.]|nr:twin-arginine translocase TatA/TatE family subunit [Myxococcales bacterium]MCB9614670.1 twin-arginine translocase TatA/TatE family subunit [Sandaracinus sp.]MCB9620612.1 twin-arginine translocase TatA/TatE family subunit [Sandaracinus sp.]MCB9632353.1 twin-arginine translocase TatA/TatE family subunit [Sandaracinus sp.]